MLCMLCCYSARRFRPWYLLLCYVILKKIYYFLFDILALLKSKQNLIIIYTFAGDEGRISARFRYIRVRIIKRNFRGLRQDTFAWFKHELLLRTTIVLYTDTVRACARLLAPNTYPPCARTNGKDSTRVRRRAHLLIVCQPSSTTGGSKNRNSRNPRNPPKFTKSNVYYQLKSTLCNKIHLYKAKII